MAARKGRPAPLDECPAGLATEVAAEIARKGALPLSKLTKVKLARTAGAELQEQLIRSGFERTAKHLRIPVAEQLLARLRSDGLVPLAGLGRKLAAVSQADAKEAAWALARAGEIRLVVARGKDHLALPSPDFVEPPVLRRLLVATDALTKLLRKAGPKRGQPDRSLSRSEAVALFQELRAVLGGEGAGAAAAPPVVSVTPPIDSALLPAVKLPPRRLVLDALATLAERDPLVYVPELVHSLVATLTPEQTLQVLTEASQEGVLELRPESGIRTLSTEDAALCVPGPQGTLLSYVRLRFGGGA